MSADDLIRFASDHPLLSGFVLSALFAVLGLIFMTGSLGAGLLLLGGLGILGLIGYCIQKYG